MPTHAAIIAAKVIDEMMAASEDIIVRGVSYMYS
jgi:hypothetical protein